MPASRLHLLSLPIAGMLLAACGSASPSPSPSPEPTPPAEAGVRLRVTMVQALPPAATFGLLPSVVITLDGRVLTGGAVPAIFPGPLVMPVIEQPITPAGWARIVAAARDAGLLAGARDFTGGGMPPGSLTARLEIVADGRLFDLVGDPNRIMVCVTAPCIPQPGTPEAFGGFLSQLTNLSGWLDARDLGPQGVYAPAGYGLIVGPPPVNNDNLVQRDIAWPLDGGFAAFGTALADGSGRRCGMVSGDAAAALRPALLAANQLTKWRDPVDGSFHGLTVQPLLPGDGDPCEGLV
jgi:hypothetical protein